MYKKALKEYLDSIYKESEHYTKDFFYGWYTAVGEYLLEEGMDIESTLDMFRQHPINIAQVASLCPSLDPKVFAARYYVGIFVPTTEEEGFRILDDLLAPDEKMAAVQQEKDEFVTNEHFGLGMWIRNNWVYRLESDDKVVKDRYDRCNAMLTGMEPADGFIFMPADIISSDFLEKYYDHLKSIYN